MTGNTIKVSNVAADRPQAIATAIKFQKGLVNIGISPRIVVSAASIIGRKRTIADSSTDSQGDLPACKCRSI